jgi:5-methylcytosine-specific restriction enzyme A
LEGELQMALCRHRDRERWLRDEKIAQAKIANDGRLPCEVCGFDFFVLVSQVRRRKASGPAGHISLGGWVVSGCVMRKSFEVYGEIGRDYAQVHHPKPLGGRTKPSLIRLDELAVVCANCHVMAHRRGLVRPLEGLLAERL